MTDQASEFKVVFNDAKWSDDFYRFLQVVFHLYPEDKFHQLLKEEASSKITDEEIYKSVQARLPDIKPFLSELTYALPALKKQKKEIANQTVQIHGGKTRINGYVEIGSTGRYVNALKKQLTIDNTVFLVNNVAPSNSVADIMERGQLNKPGTFVNINGYAPINNDVIPVNSIDLVTCYIGLHHCPIDKLESFIASVFNIIRPGGEFVIRDHDVKSKEMATFVSLVHTVFNLGLNESWESEKMDFKNFKPVEEWAKILTNIGFRDSGERILQDNDPSDNTLMLFKKP